MLNPAKYNLPEEKIQLMQEHDVNDYLEDNDVLLEAITQLDIPKEYLRPIRHLLKFQFISPQIGFYSLGYIEQTPIEVLKKRWTRQRDFFRNLREEKPTVSLLPDQEIFPYDPQRDAPCS